MFTSLEGMAKDNAKMIDENGDLHVTRILDGLDSLYGVSMTFQSLNAALCGLQQRPMESACAYYNCMVQITVILRERYGNHYRLMELARMSKDCFYAGLLPQNCPMVVHLKDEPHTTPLDLLRALLQQEESDALTRTHYPPSISIRPSHPQSWTPQYSMTPWMPWKVGTTTDSSSVSGKLPQSANPRVAVASTARKKVTIGINAKRPSPRSSKNCLISKTGSERSRRRGL